MKKVQTKITLIFTLLFIITFWILKHDANSIADISESNPKYFLVIYGDKWLKISNSKKDIFFNKIFFTCPESVVVPEGEEVKVLKPKAWKNISKRDNNTVGLKIDFYTDGKIKYNQTEIDSISLIEIRSCGK